MTFGEKLKSLREAAGLSERELAEKSGVAYGTLHRYGLGLNKPTLAAAAKLAAALGADCRAFAECDDVAGEPVKARKRSPAKARAKRSKNK